MNEEIMPEPPFDPEVVKKFYDRTLAEIREVMPGWPFISDQSLTEEEKVAVRTFAAELRALPPGATHPWCSTLTDRRTSLIKMEEIDGRMRHDVTSQIAVTITATKSAAHIEGLKPGTTYEFVLQFPTPTEDGGIQPGSKPPIYVDDELAGKLGQKLFEGMEVVWDSETYVVRKVGADPPPAEPDWVTRLKVEAEKRGLVVQERGLPNGWVLVSGASDVTVTGSSEFKFNIDPRTVNTNVSIEGYYPGDGKKARKTAQALPAHRQIQGKRKGKARRW